MIFIRRKEKILLINRFDDLEYWNGLPGEPNGPESPGAPGQPQERK